MILLSSKQDSPKIRKVFKLINKYDEYKLIIEPRKKLFGEVSNIRWKYVHTLL